MRACKAFSIDAGRGRWALGCASETTGCGAEDEVEGRWSGMVGEMQSKAGRSKGGDGEQSRVRYIWSRRSV